MTLVCHLLTPFYSELKHKEQILTHKQDINDIVTNGDT